ncbi:ATP-binding protein [Candidatus Pyrohabitans sp.]
MKASVGTKVMLAVGVIVFFSVQGIFYYMSESHERSMMEQLHQQAKSIADQILLVRLWAAEHRERVAPVPAELTYELSELSNEMYNYKIKLVTPKPRDPENYPSDSFERRVIQEFQEGGGEEVFEIYGEFYNYAVPLYVEEPCLKCHVDQGYREGDLRGALVVEIPVSGVLASLSKTRQELIVYGFLLSLAIMLAILGIMRMVVIMPLRKVKEAALRLARRDYSARVEVDNKDELGDLARVFNSMVEELKDKEAQVIQSEKMATVGKLAAGIAHQINNPLANILLYSQIHREEVKNPETKKVLEIIEDEASLASKVVQGLLDFSRQREFRREAVQVNEIIGKAINIIKPQLQYKNIKLELNLDESLPEIQGDSAKLLDAFINIATNAIDAMDNGGKLGIRTYRGNEKVVVEITDTGVGIPEEHLSRIFDPFFTTKEVGEGTGLGLYITYGIIKKHGGEIKVESRVGEGTRFTIYLPGEVNAGDTDS